MNVRYSHAVALLCALLLFFALGNHQLQNSTEPRVAGIAMEMHLSNNWVTPTLNGEPFLEKPPLSLWLDAAAIRVIGPVPLAVRLASAFAGLLTLWALYHLLRRFGRPHFVALGAVCLLLTTATFWSNARQVGEDALLTLGVTVALLAFFHASRHRQFTTLPVGRWLLFSLGIVISTLSKGVLGLALPGVVIFAYLVVETMLERRFVLSHWLRPLMFTLLALIPLLIWLYFLYGQGGIESLKAVLWTNSVGRFNGEFVEAGHYEPFYYYFSKLPEAFLPWNLLVYLGLWHFRKQLVQDRHLLFFSLWLLAQFLLLTLASSKRMVYLMSLTPAAAVIASEYLAVLRQRLRDRAGSSVRAHRWLERSPALAVGVVGLVCAGYLSSAFWLAPRLDKKLSFVPLTERVRALQAEGKEVVLFQPSERLAGASVFYSQSLLGTAHDDRQLQAMLSGSARTVAIMESEEAPRPPLNIVEQVKVGDRVYYFVSR
ncbi:ArnT family glycosyltransferase [Pseudomonas sp. NPDC088444]|uniref:ArnT family glycosyltransferase n=1 Tax=Pseudomonas sp. NPDC088444 TaxID=3364456 RepID=UPI00384C86E1